MNTCKDCKYFVPRDDEARTSDECHGATPQPIVFPNPTGAGAPRFGVAWPSVSPDDLACPTFVATPDGPVYGQ